MGVNVTLILAVPDLGSSVSGEPIILWGQWRYTGVGAVSSCQEALWHTNWALALQTGFDFEYPVLPFILGRSYHFPVP